MKIILLLLTLVIQPAFAGAIYKCKDAQGSVIFQQTACNVGQSVSVQTFQKVPDSPYKTQGDSGKGNSKRERRAARSDAVADDAQDAPAPAGYECDDGRARWVQTDPCPATSGGRIVNGQIVLIPVLQTNLSSSELCERINAGAATKKDAGSSVSEIYERNKLWRDAEDKLEAVRRLLEANGCDCECDCDCDGHGVLGCTPCLACQVGAEVGR